MNAKQIADAINVELVKMLNSGLIDEEQQTAISEMVNNVTSTNDNPRVTYSDDMKNAYFNGRRFRRQTTGYYARNVFLHIEVAEYYTGIQIPEGYEVHHKTQDADGNYDKTKNNIEDLQILTKQEHFKMHKKQYHGSIIEYVCANCGKKFKAFYKYNRKYCSIQCRDEHKHKMTHKEFICQYCGKKFTAWHTRKRKFCSRKCYRLSMFKNQPIET